MKKADLDDMGSLDMPPYEPSDKGTDYQSGTSHIASSISQEKKPSKWDKYMWTQINRNSGCFVYNLYFIF